jgi:hypothetical protein
LAKDNGKEVIKMAKKEYPEWAKTVYRGVRAGISAGIVAVMALRIDLAKPDEALKVVVMAFGTGFIVAFGKWFRELLDEKFGIDSKSIVAKTMII